MARFEVNPRGEARDKLEDQRLAVLNKLEDLKNNSGRAANPDKEEYWESIKAGLLSLSQGELNSLVSDTALQQRVSKTKEGQRILSLAKDVYIKTEKAFLEARLQLLKDRKKLAEEAIKRKEEQLKKIYSTLPEMLAGGDKELGERVKEIKIRLYSPEREEEIERVRTEKEIKDIEREIDALNKGSIENVKIRLRPQANRS
ncbi:MAG: hypothetical protein Q8R36_00010 [bacterium]|nr:hypothetical protein [bacterium]